MRFFTTSAAALVLAAVTSPALRAQVLINEIDFSASGQWIEIYNASSTEVDLSSWSIYQATQTPFSFGDYWWGFPTGTKIQPADYLRVFWGQAIQTSSDPRDIYTGDSNFNFLFGHGFEKLDRQLGALAICKTKENRGVNLPNIFADWWQWGGTGFARESIAINTQPRSLWIAGNFVPEVAEDRSLIRIETLDTLPHPLTTFREDTSPTPLAGNAVDYNIRLYGTSCDFNRQTPLELQVDGIPFHGNENFGVTVLNTRGPAYLEVMGLIISISGKTMSFGNCVDNVLDPSSGMLTDTFAAQTGSTFVGLPLIPPSAIGVQIRLQGVSFDPNSYGFTQRLDLTLSK